MNRRRFLQSLAAAPALAAGLSSCTGRPLRPNVLFVISDDQSWIHAGAYGSPFVKTPAFDRVAKEGVLFQNCFVSSPSCCPSRGSVLSGQDFYRLREASMNHTAWPPANDIPLYTDMLADNGYKVGYTGKGWGPGNWKTSGRAVSPAGAEYNQHTLQPPGRFLSNIDYAANLGDFLNQLEDAPFCFWVGFQEPHREFEDGIAKRHGKNPEVVEVPAFLPSTPEVRGDVADYAFEIEYYDQQLAKILSMLEERGVLDDTLVIVTSDNGMAFPRAKGNLYDYGTHMPLAIRWANRVKGGRKVADFVSHRDVAPTILEATQVRVPGQMTGRSLMFLLDADEDGQIESDRDFCVFGIERHFPGSRPQGAGYPSRAIRTGEFLYIQNLTPDRNPVGDHPGPSYPDGEPVGGYGDTDGGPSKTKLFFSRAEYPQLFEAAFGKRPAEELYRVADDPSNLNNLAADPLFATQKEALRVKLTRYLEDTRDPRVLGRGDELDAVMLQYPALASANAASGAPR